MEAFICSVFRVVRQRLRLAAESFSEMQAVIFRMPESILGEAEPALRRLSRNLALLALGSTYRPPRQLARFPAQQRDSHVFELTLQGRVPLSTSLDPSLHLRRPQQIRLSNEDTSDFSDLEDDGESIKAGVLPSSSPARAHQGGSPSDS